MRYHAWYMLFADRDIFLIDEMSDELNAKLEIWTQILKSKRFRLSKTKT